jgi:hypothetical protein
MENYCAIRQTTAVVERFEVTLQERKPFVCSSCVRNVLNVTKQSYGDVTAYSYVIAYQMVLWKRWTVLTISEDIHCSNSYRNNGGSETHNQN